MAAHRDASWNGCGAGVGNSPADQARKRLLLALRQIEPSVAANLRALREEVAAPSPSGDMEDAALESSLREMEAALAERRVHTVRRIGEALRRLDRGTYGLCGHCGRTIHRSRLEAVPFATLCRRCQQEDESGHPIAQGPRPLYVAEEDEAA